MMEALGNPRYHMWSRLIPGYEDMSKNEKIRAKKYACAEGQEFHSVQPTEEDTMKAKYYQPDEVTLDHCYEESTSLTIKGSPLRDFSDNPVPYWITPPTAMAPATKKKECAMYAPIVNVNTIDTNEKNETSARNYLNGRANTIFHDKQIDLRRKFGLIDLEEPKTPQELVDRIKDGQFTIEGWEDSALTWGSSASSLVRAYIHWRDPSVAKDYKGFEKALPSLEAEYTKIQDSIIVKTPAETLVELQAWEAA